MNEGRLYSNIDRGTAHIDVWDIALKLQKSSDIDENLFQSLFTNISEAYPFRHRNVSPSSSKTLVLVEKKKKTRSFNELITLLISMGFDEGKAAHALHMCNYNVDRAVNMLITEVSEGFAKNLHHTLKTTDISHCSTDFPRHEERFFIPSELQKCILDHLLTVRCDPLVSHKHGLLVMATALGKTILSALDIEKELQEDTDLRLVFLVHTRAIRDSALKKFKQHFDGRHGVTSAHFCVFENGISASHLSKCRFIFALHQSANHFFSSQYSAFASRVTHIVFDEAHHMVAPSYSRLFGRLCKLPHVKYVLGMTATPYHACDKDGTTLRTMFRDIVYVDLPWTTAKAIGLFPRVDYYEVLDNVQQKWEFGRMAYKRGGFISRLTCSLENLGLQTSVSENFLSRVAPDNIRSIYVSYQRSLRSRELVQKKKCLIFVDSISSAESLKRSFNSRGILACAVHSAVRNVEAVFSLFENGGYSVLISVDMLNEGWDCPQGEHYGVTRVRQ
ncbi:hypothetical protein PCE1_001048 [Barthelona sp. PCE]